MSRSAAAASARAESASTVMYAFRTGLSRSMAASWRSTSSTGEISRRASSAAMSVRSVKFVDMGWVIPLT